MLPKSSFGNENNKQESPGFLDMAFEVPTIKYDPARLVVVSSPKVGSTTLIGTFLAAAGFVDTISNPRVFLRSDDNEAKARAAGLTIEERDTDDVVQMRQDLQDYEFMLVFRDPVQRLTSAYRNKTNRYCKRFLKSAYYYGKLRQFMKGPPEWSDINCGNSYMRRFISLEEFVAGLEEHGVEWDNHYAQQTGLAAVDKITYDHIVRLEDLDASLPGILADRGLSEEALARVSSTQRFNSTSSAGSSKSAIPEELNARIKALYQDDVSYFDALDSGAP